MISNGMFKIVKCVFIPNSTEKTKQKPSEIVLIIYMYIHLGPDIMQNTMWLIIYKQQFLSWFGNCFDKLRSPSTIAQKLDVNSCGNIHALMPTPGGGGGGGYSTKFYSGSSAQGSKRLPFSTAFLTEKVTLPYTFHRKCTPFTYLRTVRFSRP